MDFSAGWQEFEGVVQRLSPGGNDGEGVGEDEFVEGPPFSLEQGGGLEALGEGLDDLDRAA